MCIFMCMLKNTNKCARIIKSHYLAKNGVCHACKEIITIGKLF